MKNETLMAAVFVVCSAAAAAAQPAKPAPSTPGEVPIMAISGCLRQEGANWFVANATEPAPSTAGADSAAPTGPTTGRNRYQLIGIGEFNVAASKDRLVTVKGLFIKAAPVSRLNLTSLKPLADSCPAK